MERRNTKNADNATKPTRDLGHFLVENKTDLEKLSKYIHAIKTNDTTYKPALKKVEEETKKSEDTQKPEDAKSKELPKSDPLGIDIGGVIFYGRANK